MAGVLDTFSNIMALPDDVTAQIFFRLSIKDVRSCSFVCKTWRNIISDPNFSDLYAKNSNNTQLLYFAINVLKTDDLDEDFNLFLMEIPRNDEDRYSLTRIVSNYLPSPMDLLHEIGQCSFTFIGSCSGYICFAKRNIVYVANPVTGGDCVALPGLKSKYDCIYAIGLSRDNKLKVLGHYGPEWEVFTVGSDNNWRKLPIKSLSNGDVLLYNGVVHWIPHGKNGFPEFIYTFDLYREEEGRIPLPPNEGWMVGKLMVLNSRLSLLSGEYEGDEDMVVTWTMQQYGVAESWTKEVILKSSHSYSFRAELQDGKMIFTDDSSWLVKFLNCYDVHQKKFSKTIELTSPKYLIQDICSFSPSFSSRADRLCQKDDEDEAAGR